MAITGLSKETFEKLQVDAGAAFINLGITDETTKEEFKTILEEAKSDNTKLIGATEGGFSFAAESSYRKPSVDGLNENNVKGLQISTGVNVHMSFTSKEITPENFARAMGNAKISESSPGHTVITARYQLEDESYIPEMCFVGAMADGKRIVVVQLMNVLNIAGTSFTSNDNGEGSLEFDMTAHMEDPWDENPPYRVHYFVVSEEETEMPEEQQIQSFSNSLNTTKTTNTTKTSKE